MLIGSNRTGLRLSQLPPASGCWQSLPGRERQPSQKIGGWRSPLLSLGNIYAAWHFPIAVHPGPSMWAFPGLSRSAAQQIWVISLNASRMSAGSPLRALVGLKLTASFPPHLGVVSTPGKELPGNHRKPDIHALLVLIFLFSYVEANVSLWGF